MLSKIFISAMWENMEHELIVWIFLHFDVWWKNWNWLVSKNNAKEIMSAVSILNRVCKTFTKNWTVSEQIRNLPGQGAQQRNFYLLIKKYILGSINKNYCAPFCKKKKLALRDAWNNACLFYSDNGNLVVSHYLGQSCY